MSVIINGSTGITTPGISNSEGYTGDGLTIAAGAPSGAVTLDASGNLGIGTTSPARKLDIYDATAPTFALHNSTSGTGSTDGFLLFTLGADTTLVNYENGYMAFSTNATERARIDSSGNLLVGTTSVPSGAGSGSGWVTGAFNGPLRSRTGTDTYGGNAFSFFWTSGNAQLWVDSTNVGNISISSDYRIKQKIETQNKPAIDRVMQLRPVTYELQDYGDLFKADGVAREGFIAHELQAVIPSAVEGEKDAPNQIQSLKLDALCSVLVKAIQEQQAIINAQQAALESLTARVAALEGQP